jgi:peroxiredoxin
MRLKNIGILVFLIVISLPSALHARELDRLESGLKIGEMIPSFSVIDYNDKVHDLNTMSGEKGVIFLFTRSMDWCPFCQQQALGWNDNLERFSALGYNVVLLTYDPPEILARFVKKHDIKYLMVSDKDSVLIKGFGILNEEMKEGTPYYGIPHPVIYVINPEGVITHRYSEKDYKLRPEIDAVYNDLTGQKIELEIE